MHRTNIVKNLIRESKIIEIMNVPYSPEFNGIEKLWAAMKQKFRKELLERKTENKRLVLRSICERIIEEFSKEQIRGFANNGLKILMKGGEDHILPE